VTGLFAFLRPCWHPSDKFWSTRRRNCVAFMRELFGAGDVPRPETAWSFDSLLSTSRFLRSAVSLHATDGQPSCQIRYASFPSGQTQNSQSLSTAIEMESNFRLTQHVVKS
jgi:hypothetical protein